MDCKIISIRASYDLLVGILKGNFPQNKLKYFNTKNPALAPKSALI